MTFCSLVMKKNVHAQSSALVLNSSENRRNEVLFLILNGTRKKMHVLKYSLHLYQCFEVIHNMFAKVFLKNYKVSSKIKSTCIRQQLSI